MHVENMLEGWNETKVEGKSFDEELNIEGIPLWWFFKRIFIPEVLPKKLGNFNFMDGSSPSFAEKAQWKISSLLFGKYILQQENRKISQLKKSYSHSSSEKALFLSFSNHINQGGNIFRINDIVNKVSKDNKITPFVLFCDPLSGDDVKKIEDKPNLYRYVDQEIRRKSKQESKRLHSIWKSISKKRKRKMLLGGIISYWDNLQDAFNAFFSEDFLYILCLQFFTFKKILKEENVQVLVLTSQNSIHEKSALAAAKINDIPTVLVQHGTLDEPKVNPDLIHNSKLAVFSKARKRGLVRLGVKEEDIVVTGAVIFDEIAKFRSFSNKNQNLNILIITSPTFESGQLPEQEYWKRFEKVMKEIQKIPCTSITIKLHPREKGFETYQQLCNNNHWDNVKIIQDNSRNLFYSSLGECDLFIHLNSTAVLEGMILDKPAITLEITSGWKESITKKSGCAIEATERTNMQEAIHLAMKKEEELREKRRKFAEKMAGVVDGKAYHRVVDLIYDTINNKEYK